MRKLFLIDALGAVLSAFLLGVVLVKFEEVFGLPPCSLYLLASFPIVFAVYDLFCYLCLRKIGVYLKLLAVVNLLYCVLSISLAAYHCSDITPLGWGYVIVEILIIVALAIMEWRAGQHSMGFRVE